MVSTPISLTFHLECLCLISFFFLSGTVLKFKNKTYMACNSFVSWIAPPCRWWMLNYKRVSWFCPSSFSFPLSPFRPNSTCSAKNRVCSLTATLLSSRYDRKTWSVLWPERKSKIKNIYWYIRWWANMRTCQWINCDLFDYLVEIVYPNRLVPKDNIWLEPSGVFRLKNKIKR